MAKRIEIVRWDCGHGHLHMDEDAANKCEAKFMFRRTSEHLTSEQARDLFVEEFPKQMVIGVSNHGMICLGKAGHLKMVSTGLGNKGRKYFLRDDVVRLAHRGVEPCDLLNK